MSLCRIGNRAVSVFYLRAGYSPNDYMGAAEWAAREAMESCSAVSCPSVAYQLVGAKKIQQDLAAPGVCPFQSFQRLLCIDSTVLSRSEFSVKL
jgi:Eukaryotic glutathione synthase